VGAALPARGTCDERDLAGDFSCHGYSSVTRVDFPGLPR
jgi:hypothetical protein